MVALFPNSLKPQFLAKSCKWLCFDESRSEVNDILYKHNVGGIPKGQYISITGHAIVERNIFLFREMEIIKHSKIAGLFHED